MKRGLVLAFSLLALLYGCSPSIPTSGVEPGTGTVPTPMDKEPTEEPTEEPTKEPIEDEGIKWPRRGHFYRKLTYPDGVSVEVVRVKHAKLSQVGRAKGVDVGDPIQILYIRVTNGSGKKISLDAPLSNMTYGPDGEKAASVHDRGIDSIGGSLMPGRAKTGTYGFAVPRSYHSLVWLEFGFDSDHDIAVINGPLK